MPDIDSDFAKGKVRDKVIEYVKAKYGEKAVCSIMTKSFQGPKKAVQTAAKYYGLKMYGTSLYNLGKTISADIPSEPGTSFSTRVDGNGKITDEDGSMALKDWLAGKYAQDKDAGNIIHWATVLEGSFVSYGVHAAGIVISDNRDVSEYVPLRWNSKMKTMTTQCDMVQVEENGLLKFDFLGLRNLNIINDTAKAIERNYGIIIDIDGLDLEDVNVYREIFSRGKTNSIFQFESNGMKTMLKRFKPTCFEDLIILVSMFRPGPLQYLDDVIEVKQGRKEMTFLCPQLEPILGKTYGAIVYQEQVMEICQKLAGFTLGRADTVRRYMSKKKADKLEHERDSFNEGCIANGIGGEVADGLFSQMMDFASYAFNKSHATAYAKVAYTTAWLKYYYPAEFLASALNWCEDNEKMAGLTYEASQCGVKVFAPDINRSDKKFAAKRGEIYFGLSSVKGVKDHADEILEERKNGSFMSISDFVLRTNPNTSVVTALIEAGAFDEFSKNRASMKLMADEIKEIAPEIRKKKNFVAACNVVLPVVETATPEELVKLQEDSGLKAEIKEPTTVKKLEARLTNAQSALEKLQHELALVKPHIMDEDKAERLNRERRLLGMYITEHPADLYIKAEDAVDINELSEGDAVICGVITNLNIRARKADNAKMAFFRLEDKSGSVDVCVFAKAYRRFSSLIEEGKAVRIAGTCRVEHEDDDETGEANETVSFIAENLQYLNKKNKAVMLPVKSVSDFRVNIEAEFKKNYESRNGYELVIYDEREDKFVDVPYRVSETVLQIPGAEIMLK
jgi:DNA polymerase-3 subunit alpha